MDTSQLIMLVAAICGLTVLMISTRRRIRKAQRPEHSIVRERYAELQRESKARGDVEQVILELDQVARQIHGRLDTKLVRLEVVIRDADERIERLTRLVRAASGCDAVDITLSREHPDDPPAPDPDGSPSAAIHRLADGGLSPLQIARESGKTVGEVELTLALRKVKEEADSPPQAVGGARPLPGR